MSIILDLHIRPHKKDIYLIEVFERGKKKKLVSSIFNYKLSFLTEFELNRLDFNANDPVARMDRLTEFGRKLYKEIFNPQIEGLWKRYRSKTNFLILCIRVSSEVKGLEALPWETLNDGVEFLSAGKDTTISRLPMDIPIQTRLSALIPPLKMLAIISSPLDLEENERLQIEREQEILLQAVNSSTGQGKLFLEFEDEAKLPVIENCLENRYQIIHYSGHGYYSKENGSGLLLENENGEKKMERALDILTVLENSKDSIRLVVLSGCQTARTSHVEGFSDLAHKLVLKKIPSVIAMQFSITDEGGLKIADMLYPKLVSGFPLEIALSDIRRELLESCDPNRYMHADALAPVLFTADGLCLQQNINVAPKSEIEKSNDVAFHVPLPQFNFGFYGRRREFRKIRDEILTHNKCAIIVHGIGGIGKSALINYVAQRLHNKFKYVYAFDCSNVALVPEKIILELHHYFEKFDLYILNNLMHKNLSSEQKATSLAEVFNQLPILLIFDNFENQLAISNHVFKIKDKDLRIFLNTLITATNSFSFFLFSSRYRIEFDSSLVNKILQLPLGALSRPEALGLMQKLPHLTSATYLEKMHIFEIFGGHPYALIIIDRQCENKHLIQVLQDASTMHVELQEFMSIELSYNQISKRSRELLNRIAVFHEPIPKDAAEWMLGEKIEISMDIVKQFDRQKLPEKLQTMNNEELFNYFQKYIPEQRNAQNIDQLINELISWGLLIPIRKNNQIHTVIVHSLVREFCKDKQKLEIWRENLIEAAAYYTNQTKLLSENDKTLTDIWQEMKAFELLMKADNYNEAATLLMHANDFLVRGGFGRYLENQYKRLINKVDSNTAARLGHNLAMQLENRGDYSAALAGYEKSLKTFEKCDDHIGIAKSLLHIGTLHLRCGDNRTSLVEFTRLLDINEKLGDSRGIAICLHEMGIIHYNLGNYALALSENEKSLKLFEEYDNLEGIASSLHQIGMTYQAQGNYSTSLEKYKKSLKIREEIEHLAGIADSLHQIGWVYQDLGDYPTALANYEKSLNIRESLEDISGIARLQNQIGNIYFTLEGYDTALANYERSRKLFEELSDIEGIAGSSHQIGLIHQKQENYTLSLVEFEKSFKMCKKYGYRKNMALSLNQMGIIHGILGDYDTAFLELEETLEIMQNLNDREGTAMTQGNIGFLLIAMERYAEAFENLLQAWVTLVAMRSPHESKAASLLKKLRAQWGVEKFDQSWLCTIGREVPEFLKEAR